MATNVMTTRSWSLVALACALGSASSAPTTRRTLLRGTALSSAATLAGASTASQAAEPVATARASVPFDVPPGALSGRTVLVTGASAGLGKETAARLASGGATVYMASRNHQRGQAALDEVVQRAGRAAAERVHLLDLDLADLASVRAAASAFRQRERSLDVLVNNAGVMAIPERQLTADGFEKQLGVNHLGHFALTALLLPALEQSRGGRVVCVSSSAHLLAKPEDALPPLSEPAAYSAWGAYAQSKLANVLFASELDRQFKAAALPLTALSLHPGVVRTDLARYVIDGRSEPMDAGAFATLAPPQRAVLGLVAKFTKSVEEGAATQVFLAAGADSSDDGWGYGENGGTYWSDVHPARESGAAQRLDLARALWAESERLTGCTFESLGRKTQAV